jgi:hypothetical protein
LDESAFSFSNLFLNSDIIVCGSVEDIKIDSKEYKIIFRIENCITTNFNKNPIEIGVPLSDGFYIPDEPYLKKNNQYLLFLQFENNGWKIPNKIAGVLDHDLTTDVRKISEKYHANTKLFSKECSTTLQDLFFSMRSKFTKVRLLYDLKNLLGSSDKQFLASLFKLKDKQIRFFSILQLGRLNIESMRAEIENLLQNSADFEIIFHSIVALGDMKNSNSLQLLLQYLNSPEPAIRRAAIAAVGKIRDKKIVIPLKELYPRENDIGQRLAIITAISRLSDLNSVINALRYFQSIEADPLVLSIINKKINPL